jgi:GINS complex subunit 4
VKDVGDQINSQQNMIDDLEDHFESVIYQMDLDRAKYVLTDYLRMRLKKIQKFVFYLTSSNELLSRLSAAEVKFAKSYLKIAMGHFEKSVLQHIPERYRNLKESIATVPRPNLDAFVFFKVNEDVGEISCVGSDETVDLLQGETKVMRYKDIRPYVSDRSISLL